VGDYLATAWQDQGRALYWLMWVPLAFMGFIPHPGGKSLANVDVEKVLQAGQTLLDALKPPDEPTPGAPASQTPTS
jgi:hypothetical protein